MNRALELARGAWVTHLDDDDEMTPNRIERLLEVAVEERADFLWHRFLAQREGAWVALGDERLALGDVTTGSIFYHRYFTRIRFDPYCYRLAEPGDWNRVRRIRALRPRTRFVAETLLRHYAERGLVVTPQEGERFLE